VRSWVQCIQNFSQKPQGKNHLGVLGIGKWKGNIKTRTRERRCEGGELIYLTEDRDQCQVYKQ
jgi:hypothetical protein